MKFLKAILFSIVSLWSVSLIASDSLKYAGSSNPKIRLLKKSETDNGSRGIAFDLSKNADEAPKRVIISFSGNFRILADYRVMKNYYPITSVSQAAPRTLNLNGWGQSNNTVQNQNVSNPLLYLETNIKPTAKSSISLGYTFNHDFNGSNDTLSRSVNVWRLLMASAQIETKTGKFKLSTAGASGFPTVLSPLTSGFNTFHFNPFFRLPWDWFKSNNDKLDYFYNFQSVALDPRYTSTSAGVQGIILECSELPGKFGVNMIFGKNNQTGGFLETNDPPAQGIPQTPSVRAIRQTIGGRLYKYFGKHVIGVNAISNSGYINNYSTEKRTTQYFLTTNGTFNFNKMFLDFEGGISEFQTPAPFGQWGRPATFGQSYSSGVNQILSFKIGFKKGSVRYPSFFQVYSIGKDVVNQNSPIINTTGMNVTGFIPTYPYEVNVFRSCMLEADQVANNRNGFLFDITREFRGKTKLNLAANYSQEISNEWNVITMQHQVSKYQRSQFSFFQTRQGPYGRILNQFIRSYETFRITDTDSSYKKNFYVWDFTIKRKAKLFGKPLMLGSYTSFNSVSDKLWPVPVFTDEAFLRQIYEEVNFNYLITAPFNLTAQFGYEKVLGNKRLETTTDGKIVNQNGYCYGIGFDWVFSKNVGFYIRQVWFSHKDVNFTNDKFNGWNTLAEIKAFF